LSPATTQSVAAKGGGSWRGGGGESDRFKVTTARNADFRSLVRGWRTRQESKLWLSDRSILKGWAPGEAIRVANHLIAPAHAVSYQASSNARPLGANSGNRGKGGDGLSTEHHCARARDSLRAANGIGSFSPRRCSRPSPFIRRRDEPFSAKRSDCELRKATNIWRHRPPR